MSLHAVRAQPALLAPARRRPWSILVTALATVTAPVFVHAADPALPAGHPATTTQPVDVVGDRVAFLVARLASVEASLKAVESELKAAGYKAALSADTAKRYERGNELMDRKGGGPMPWDAFYGKTANAFFYHPTDPNTHYLFGNDNPRGLAPVPATQRPPQLDYFYRANDRRTRQAQTEAAVLAGKADALLARRRQLEGQQVLLWTKLAAAMVAQRQLPDLPLYTHRLQSDPGSGGSVVAAAGRFLLTIDQAMAELADLPSADGLSGDYRWLRDVLTHTRADLQAQVNAATGNDAEAAAAAQPLVASARRAAVIAESVADAAQAATDADAAHDDAQRTSSRGLLQAGLLELAEATAALDEDVQALAVKWHVEPTADVRPDRPALPPLPAAPPGPAVPPSAASSASARPAARSDVAAPAGPAPVPDASAQAGAVGASRDNVPVAGAPDATAAAADRAGFVSLFDGRTLRGWRGADHEAVPADWAVVDGCLVRSPVSGPPENLRTAAAFSDFELELEFRVEPRSNSGIIYRGGPEYQILDDDAYPKQGRAPLTCTGSDFALHPVTRTGAARPAGQWNQARLVVRGDHVEHWLNGQKVVEYELGTPAWRQAVAGHPRFGKQLGFGLLRPAPIELQSLGGRVWFRDLRIKPLSP